MKKILSAIISILILLLSFQTQSFAEPSTKSNQLKTISTQEKSLLNKQRIYEDSNETTPVQPKQQPIPKPKDSKDSSEPEIEAESYILMDANNGMILADKAKDQPRPPASMTKMMTAYIVLDRIEQGKLNWNDEVVVSKRAEEIDEAQIFLVENERITVKELMTGFMVQSANDAAVALAEHIAGSEEAFVALMNKKAKKNGFNQYPFYELYRIRSQRLSRSTKNHWLARYVCL